MLPFFQLSISGWHALLRWVGNLPFHIKSTSRMAFNELCAIVVVYLISESFGFQLRAINMHDLLNCDISWGFSRWQHFPIKRCPTSTCNKIAMLVWDYFINIHLQSVKEWKRAAKERTAELMQMAFKFLWQIIKHFIIPLESSCVKKAKNHFRFLVPLRAGEKENAKCSGELSKRRNSLESIKDFFLPHWRRKKKMSWAFD